MSYITLNKEDFHKDTKFKRVLNFDFSTHMLFRCTKKRYAEDFIKGKIRFNQPKVWIKQEEDGNKGQGDSLEGVFLATDKNDDSIFINSLKNNIIDIGSIDDNVTIYDNYYLLNLNNNQITTGAL